jgi:hypothetical protein
MSEPIKIPSELFHAFPVGSLSFLAGAASVISAEHGVETARDLFGLLASSEPFWADLRARFEQSPAPLEHARELPEAEIPANGTSG